MSGLYDLGDKQRQKAYNAERRFWMIRRQTTGKPQRKFDTLADAQKFADRIATILRKAGWELRDPTLRLKRGGYSSGGWAHVATGEIVLGKLELIEETMIHEVAHLAGPHRFAGHDIPWAMAMLDVIEKLHGKSARESLTAAFREKKVRYAWPHEAPRNQRHFRHWLKYRTSDFLVFTQDGKYIRGDRLLEVTEDFVSVKLPPGASRKAGGAPAIVPANFIAYTSFRHYACNDECPERR